MNANNILNIILIIQSPPPKRGNRLACNIPLSGELYTKEPIKSTKYTRHNAPRSSSFVVRGMFIPLKN